MTEIAGIDVSRETIEKLKAFASLVEKWTSKINLISKSSVPYLWDRHIVDSIQLFQLGSHHGKWVDMGSGGGFPGIIIAILTESAGSSNNMTLIESDQRKCAFLRTAIRELDLNADVMAERIEDIPPLGADVVSARALASVSVLLGYAEQHLKPDGVAIFPKGESWRKEHQEAQHLWKYSYEVINSTTSSEAAILKIKDITRV